MAENFNFVNQNRSTMAIGKNTGNYAINFSNVIAGNITKDTLDTENDRSDADIIMDGIEAMLYIFNAENLIDGADATRTLKQDVVSV